MSFKASECPICLVSFNADQHFPMIVGKCGHTVCLACALVVDHCPFCKLPIESTNLIRNYAVIDLIQQNKPSKPAQMPIIVPKGDRVLLDKSMQVSALEQLSISSSFYPMREEVVGRPADTSMRRKLMPRNSHGTSSKHSKRILINLCPEGHPLAFFKKPQVSAWCQICNQLITDRCGSCKICNYDICCQINEDFQLDDYRCIKNHSLGSFAQPYPLMKCSLCENACLWICQVNKCNQRFCEMCIEKQPPTFCYGKNYRQNLQASGRFRQSEELQNQMIQIKRW